MTTKVNPRMIEDLQDVVARNVADLKDLQFLDGVEINTSTLDSSEVLAKTVSYYGNALPDPQAVNAGEAEYILTTLANARVIKDDVTWTPDGYGDHYLLGGTAYVAVLKDLDFRSLSAEQFGVNTQATPSTNSDAIEAVIQRAKTSTSDIYSAVVKLGTGKYQFSRPIVLQPDVGTSQRLPGLRGEGTNKTEIQKVGTTTTGIAGHDVDAVIVELPADGEDYAYYGDLGDFVISGDVDGLGYGVYSIDCPSSVRSNMQVLRRLYGFYQDDCWMSRLDRVWALGSYNTGISILGGTSVTGSNLYSDGSKVKGFNLRGLQYSTLHCSCDRTANGEVTVGTAYDFELAKGVSGQFNVETTHGAEFRFVNSDGISINGGRSFNSAPVAAQTNKIFCQSSTVKFTGFDWTDSLSNLTPGEAALYDLIFKNDLSSIEFDNCVFSADLDNRFPRQLDFKFAGNVSCEPYSSYNGVVTHTLNINNGSFKQLCYVGNAGRIKLEIGVCTDSAVDALYLPLSDDGLYVPSLSTSAASPDDVMQWNENGSPSIATLEGFVQDGWLYVRPSNTGNNRTYHFKAFTPTVI